MHKMHNKKKKITGGAKGQLITAQWIGNEVRKYKTDGKTRWFVHKI